MPANSNRDEYGWGLLTGLRSWRVVLMAVTLLGALQVGAAQAPEVTKVEPPSWWANHTINPVRLLVRGTNLSHARVRATRPQTSVSDVRVNRNGTYLFVDVRIDPSAMPGDYPLILETDGGQTSVPFRLNEPLNRRTNFQGITNDDIIYLIMTDRFSDGDPTNNLPQGAPAASLDRTNPRAYHGGDLRGVINHLPYLKELGVTAIWLTPWYDNWNGIRPATSPGVPALITTVIMRSTTTASKIISAISIPCANWSKRPTHSG